MYKHNDLTAKLAQADVLAQDLAGKRVLIRTCLNVALDKQGNISDDTRIRESLPALQALGASASRVIMMAHLGRPTTAREPEFSLEVVRKRLEADLGAPVQMIADESQFASIATAAPEQKYFLLENIRYFEGEESKDSVARQAFAAKLAQLADIYVNDAFADYREAASTYDIANLLPSYLGPVFIREVKAIGYFAEPRRPFVAILGGAKLSEKLDALKALLDSADKVLVGGAMAYTLLKSQGVEVGTSLLEPDKLAVAAEIMAQYKDKLVLPVDHLVAAEFSATAALETTPEVEIPHDKLAVDIGPRTRALFVEEIAAAQSLLWNGPMGVFEWNSAQAGTKAVAEAIVHNIDAYKFAGGGDSIAAINKFSVTGFNHVSTGGGAMLAFVSYDAFPTLQAIIEKSA